MKNLYKIRFFILAFLLSATTFAQRFDWATTGGRVVGGSIPFGAVDIARDPAGNIYTLDKSNVAQQCQGDTLQPYSGTTTFIYKFDPQGNLLFMNRIGAVGGGTFATFNIETDAAGNLYVLGQPDGVNSIIVNDDTIPAVAHTSQLIKIDPNGNFVWNKNTGFAGNWEGCMLQYSNGYVYYQGGNLTVAKRDTAGNLASALTASYYSSPTAYVGLFFKGSAVFSNGDLLFTAISYGNVAYGTDTLFATANPFLTDPILLLRCDTAMNLVWARYASNVRDPDQNFIPVAIDNNDAVYAAVQVNQQMIIGNDTISSSNFTGAGAIIKIDSAGNDLWAHEFTTTNLCYAWCMQNMPDNSGIMIGGGFTGTAQFGSQSLVNNTTSPLPFVAKLDYNGIYAYAFNYLQSPFQTDANCLSSNNNGVFYVGGSLKNTDVPVFSCIAAPANVGFYIGAFTEQPDSVPTPAITINGADLTANPAFAGDIQWFLNGTAIAGANAQTYTATQSGDYSVSYEYTSGCLGSASSTVSNVIVTGISNTNNSTAITVHPNPSKGIIFIDGLNNNNAKTTIQVSDMIGRVIMQRQVNHAREQIDLSETQAGIYFVRINDGANSSAYKVIKN